MSNKVKFIQLGTDANPVANDTYNAGVSTERSLAYTKAQYPGAIIFATFYDNSGKPAQEIWANGVKYAVGGGGTVYVGTKTVDSKGTLSNTGQIYKGKYDANGSLSSVTPSVGDIYLQCKNLTGDKFDALTSTGFVYTEAERWEALAGSVNAENVWFNDNITLAGNYTQVGNITKSSTTATGSIDCSDGKTLKDLMTQIFTKEQFPTTSKTDATLTVTAKVNDFNIYTSDGSVASSLQEIRTTGLYTSLITCDETTGGKTSTIISGLLYGYANDVKGTNASKETSLSATRGNPSATAGQTATFEVSGFTSTPSKVTRTSSAGSTATIDRQNLGAVVEGTNTITVTVSGGSYQAEVSSLAAKYITSNVGTWSESNKTLAIDQQTLTATAAKDQATKTIYGVTAIQTNGQIATATSGDQAYKGEPTTTLSKLELTDTYNTANGNPKTFYVVFGSPASIPWKVVIPTKYKPTFKGYNVSTKQFDVEYTFTNSNGTWSMTNTTAGPNNIQITFS